MSECAICGRYKARWKIFSVYYMGRVFVHKKCVSAQVRKEYFPKEKVGKEKKGVC